MSMFRNLFEAFRRLEGQPVKIVMHDCKVFVGLVLTACEFSVRILNRCGDIVLIEYSHIDAVEEPQMKLCCCRMFCEEFKEKCWCEKEERCEEDCDCECDEECEGEKCRHHRHGRRY